jgi:hypothetical protein
MFNNDGRRTTSDGAEFRSTLTLPKHLFEGLPKSHRCDQAVIFFAGACETSSHHSVNIREHKLVVSNVFAQFAFFVPNVLQTVAQGEHERPSDPLGLAKFPFVNESGKHGAVLLRVSRRGEVR